MIVSAVIPLCLKDATSRLLDHRSHAYEKKFKLGHHFEFGQKVLYENHRQDLSKSQKPQRRLGPLTVSKHITCTTYQIQDDQDPTNVKTVQRNHLVECYPKKESLPAMIEEFIPSEERHDDFYELFIERRIQMVIDPTPVFRSDSLPVPIVPSSSTSTAVTPKRISNTSTDSGVIPLRALSSLQSSTQVNCPQRTPPPIHISSHGQPL